MEEILKQFDAEYRKIFKPVMTATLKPGYEGSYMLYVPYEEGAHFLQHSLESALKQQKADLIKEVEKMKYKVPHEECNNGKCEPCDNCIAFQMVNDILDDFIQLLSK